MTDRELMQQALDALELLARYENPLTKVQVRKPRDGGQIVTMYPHKVATEAAVPLRARLAQPEQEIESDWPHVEDDGCPTEKAVLQRFWREHQKQEPVAQVDYNERGNISWLFGPQLPDKTFLYTAPPQRECCCGDSSELNVVHRADAPCFHYEKREWQGLTDGDVNEIVFVERSWADAVRKVEAKLKEKNGG